MGRISNMAIMHMYAMTIIWRARQSLHTRKETTTNVVINLQNYVQCQIYALYHIYTQYQPIAL